MHVRTSTLLLVLLVALGGPHRAQAQGAIEKAFPNLGAFKSPLGLQNAGDGSNRLFVVEQAGRIKVFENDPQVSEATVFLNITDRVRNDGEMGLLGLAFHPDYETNGYLYVDYTAPNHLRSVISRFQVDPTDPNHVDPSTELVLLEVDQPATNHNGGQLAFGPDGYLYIAFGDGGDAGDKFGNGQDPTTLLGSILRVDVDQTSKGRNYAVPSDNPFLESPQLCGVAGCREEIYAYGFRNPWRFSFDPETGRLWNGDVGEHDYEEVNLVEKGGNYGWNVMEGTHCFEAQTCNQEGLTLPVWEYQHTPGSPNSVTGGYVYHGDRVPELQGRYVYGDFRGGQLWALRYGGPGDVENEELVSTGLLISSFGVDEARELYVVDFSGTIYRFEATTGTAAERDDVPGSSVVLEANYPNPFRDETVIAYTLGLAGDVELAIYDVLGRRVRRLVSGAEPAGRHQVTWDGRDQAGAPLPGGLYVYRLQAGDRVASGRLLKTR